MVPITPITIAMMSPSCSCVEVEFDVDVEAGLEMVEALTIVEVGAMETVVR